jgi:hypothetical protein
MTKWMTSASSGIANRSRSNTALPALFFLLSCQRGAPLHRDATTLTPSSVTDAAMNATSDGPVLPVVPIVIDREIDDEPMAPADAGPPDNVRLLLRVGPVDAEVFWGGKRLGIVKRAEPLEILRPRHSGPVDVVVRAPGFVPHHTRFFTDADDRVTVDLVHPTAAPGLTQWKAKPAPTHPSRR